MRGSCSSLAIVAAAAILLHSAPAGASKTDFGFHAWLGPSYTFMHEKGGTDDAQHLGGFYLLVGGGGNMGKLIGFTYEMLEIEGSFNKSHSWFHIGGSWLFWLDFRYVHITTGAGLFMNGLKAKRDGDAAYRMPCAVGFRWPIEMSLHFWRISLYGGIEFDFDWARHRVSKNRLLGDETSVYAGLKLLFNDKGAALDFRWTRGWMDDQAEPDQFLVLVDLVPLALAAKSGGSGHASDYQPAYDTSYQPSYEPAYTPPPTGPVTPAAAGKPVNYAFKGFLDDLVDSLDAMDDTYSYWSFDNALQAAFQGSFPLAKSFGVLVANGYTAGSLDEYLWHAVLDECSWNQYENDTPSLLKVCAGGSGDPSDPMMDLEQFWYTAFSTLMEQYGDPGSEWSYFDFRSWLSSQVSSKTVSTKSATFSTKGASGPGVTLSFELLSFTDTEFDFNECVHYSPKVGKCPEAATTQPPPPPENKQPAPPATGNPRVK